MLKLPSLPAPAARPVFTAGAAFSLIGGLTALAGAAPEPTTTPLPLPPGTLNALGSLPASARDKFTLAAERLSECIEAQKVAERRFARGEITLEALETARLSTRIAREAVVRLQLAQSALSAAPTVTPTSTAPSTPTPSPTALAKAPHRAPFQAPLPNVNIRVNVGTPSGVELVETPPEKPPVTPIKSPIQRGAPLLTQQDNGFTNSVISPPALGSSFALPRKAKPLLAVAQPAFPAAKPARVVTALPTASAIPAALPSLTTLKTTLVSLTSPAELPERGSTTRSLPPRAAEPKQTSATAVAATPAAVKAPAGVATPAAPAPPVKTAVKPDVTADKTQNDKEAERLRLAQLAEQLNHAERSLSAADAKLNEGQRQLAKFASTLRQAMLEAGPDATGLHPFVKVSEKYAGTPYVWGGESRRGFDCSGLIILVMRELGYRTPPHSAAEQFKYGKTIAQPLLKPGDLVFFANTYKPGISHVGIYLGKRRFIHAAGTGKGTIVSSLDDAKYQEKYAGARRLIAAR